MPPRANQTYRGKNSGPTCTACPGAGNCRILCKLRVVCSCPDRGYYLSMERGVNTPRRPRDFVRIARQLRVV